MEKSLFLIRGKRLITGNDINCDSWPLIPPIPDRINLFRYLHYFNQCHTEKIFSYLLDHHL
jgi:hypothetical protein